MTLMESNKTITEAIEAAGYQFYTDIAGSANEFGGWPMTQNSWDNTNWNLMEALGSTR